MSQRITLIITLMFLQPGTKAQSKQQIKSSNTKKKKKSSDIYM